MIFSYKHQIHHMSISKTISNHTFVPSKLYCLGGSDSSNVATSVPIKRIGFARFTTDVVSNAPTSGIA